MEERQRHRVPRIPNIVVPMPLVLLVAPRITRSPSYYS
jgi:hypothetical protein